jgi:hypothetical protein
VDGEAKAGRSSGRSGVPDALYDSNRGTRGRGPERRSQGGEGLFESERTMRFSFGFMVGAVVGLGAVWYTLPERDPLEIYAEAYKQGRIDALKPRLNGNLNWELEQVCVGLWTEKQEPPK